MGESDSLLLNLVTHSQKPKEKKQNQTTGTSTQDHTFNTKFTSQKNKETTSSKPEGKTLQNDQTSDHKFQKKKKHKFKAVDSAQSESSASLTPQIKQIKEETVRKDSSESKSGKQLDTAVQKKKKSKSKGFADVQKTQDKFKQQDTGPNAKSETSKFHSVKNQSSTSLVKTASLFNHNPEIPHVELGFVKPKTEPLFSSKEFSELPIHPFLVACLRDRVQITTMTVVQQRTIPLLLQGNDCLVKSATGSGKTLAFAIPIIHSLQEVRPKIQRSDGVHALIIVPTRELAIQCYEHISTLCRSFAWLVPGCLMGGEKKKSEKARIRKGVTILIATPGRLLDHLHHTTNLSLKKVRWLVIDEADRLLDLGFEKAVSEIVSILKEQCEAERQTVLLSATLNKGVEKLAGMSLNNPAVADISAQSENTTLAGDMFVIPPKLKQHFIITPIKLRLVSLSAFIVDKCSLGGCKALIFMMTQDMVDFHHSLFKDVLQDALQAIGYGVLFFHLHGNMNQQERTEVFRNFRDAKSGILLCTDVAARGLDLPRVDWIVQYSAPTRAEDYVHRVGRTARIGSEGRSLLFLLPSEVGFVDLLQRYRIKLEEINMDKLLQSLMLIQPETNRRSKIHATLEEQASYLQGKYENTTSEHGPLLESARKAFTSYVRAYASYPQSLRSIFPFKSLHLGHVAKSMCLKEAPSVLGHKQAIAGQRTPKQSLEKTNPLQRKRKFEISEYDSGLDFEKLKKRRK